MSSSDTLLYIFKRIRCKSRHICISEKPVTGTEYRGGRKRDPHDHKYSFLCSPKHAQSPFFFESLPIFRALGKSILWDSADVWTDFRGTALCATTNSGVRACVETRRCGESFRQKNPGRRGATSDERDAASDERSSMM